MAEIEATFQKEHFARWVRWSRTAFATFLLSTILLILVVCSNKCLLCRAGVHVRGVWCTDAPVLRASRAGWSTIS